MNQLEHQCQTAVHCGASWILLRPTFQLLCVHREQGRQGLQPVQYFDADRIGRLRQLSDKGPEHRIVSGFPHAYPGPRHGIFSISEEQDPQEETPVSRGTAIESTQSHDVKINPHCPGRKVFKQNAVCLLFQQGKDTLQSMLPTRPMRMSARYPIVPLDAGTRLSHRGHPH